MHNLEELGLVVPLVEQARQIIAAQEKLQITFGHIWPHIVELQEHGVLRTAPVQSVVVQEVFPLRYLLLAFGFRGNELKNDRNRNPSLNHAI